MVSSASPVLHVVPLHTGGVDRYVRDVCAVRVNDWIAHVATDGVFIEPPRADALHACSPAVFSSLIHEQCAFAAIHAHSTLSPVRDLVNTVCDTTPIPFLLTLHDVDFAAESEPREEQRARLTFAKRAAARIAPSHFIAQLWRRVARDEERGDAASVRDSASVSVITHGHASVRTLTRVQRRFACLPEGVKFDYAVIGAIGEHKGRARLEAVAMTLTAGTRGVIVGYLENRLTPGWLIEDKLWCTGPYLSEEVPEIVAQSGAGVAFFPNVQPESFCYALSDAWAAKLPALVPDIGALGERVNESGAGWCYASTAGTASIAATLVEALSNAPTKHDHVAALRFPCLNDTVNATYAQVKLSAGDSTRTSIDAFFNALMRCSAPITHGAQLHVDTRLLRKEMIRLTGDLAFSESQLAASNVVLARRNERLSELENDIAGAQAWQEKSHNDVEKLTADYRALEANLQGTVEKYERDVAELRRAIEAYRAKFQWIPAWLRRIAKLN